MHNVRAALIFVLPSIAVTAAIWFPFGFALGGLVEEWGVVGLFSQHGTVFIADGASLLAAHRTRPLNFLPHALAFSLDRDSFFYWHILQAISVILKGACGGYIGFYITRSYRLAVIFGVLLILCPADTMQLSFRSLGINWSVSLLLIAASLITAALESKDSNTRRLLGLIATASYCTAVLMYEAVILMTGLPILLLFVRRGRQETLRILRTKWGVVVCWFSGFILCMGYLLWTATHGSATYQEDVVGGLNASLLFSIAKRWWGLGIGFYRAFYEGWVDAAKAVLLHLSNFFYPLLFIAITFSVLMALGKWAQISREPTDIRELANKSLAKRAVIAGLAAFVLAYSPYLTSLSHLFVTQRTFLAAAVAVTTVVIGAIVLLESSAGRFVGTVTSTLLIGICFVYQLYQFDKYNRTYAEVVRPLLTAVVPFMSRVAPHETGVLVNDFGYLSDVWDLGIYLQSAVTYVTGADRRMVVCESRTGRLLPRSVGGADASVDRRRRCQITEEVVSVATGLARQEQIERPVIGHLAADGTISGASATSMSEQTRLRLSHLLELGSWRPSRSFFKKGEGPDLFECVFESEWGFGHPCRTFGFFSGQVNPRGFNSFAWMVEPRAGLFFELDQPRQDISYRLQIITERAVPNQVRVFVNGTRINVEWTTSTRMVASLDGTLLRHGLNTVELMDGLQKTHSELILPVSRITISRPQ